MRPYLLQRRSSGLAARGARFRPLVECLESRIVPSTLDHSSGFASHGDLTFNPVASVSGSVAQLTTGAHNEAGSFFTNDHTFVVSDFSVQFTFKSSQGSLPMGGGFTFALQNASAHALGSNGNGFGVSGISNSFAVVFDCSTNTTGVFANGGFTLVGLSGINLKSADTFQVKLSYDGNTLSETIADIDTGGSFVKTFQENIVSLIGSHTAFVGFTAGTGQTACIFSILTFLGTFNEAQAAPVSATGGFTITGVEGQLLHNVEVATFTGPSSTTGCTAVIDWGDGTTSTGFITGPDQNGVFRVGGTHTYAEESKDVHGAPFIITVTITCGNSTATVTDNTNIAEAPLTASGGYTINAVEGQSFTATVATFVDTGGPENPNDPGDYTATIDWGDGTTSTGTITLSGNTFTVTGTHTYPEDGENESDLVDNFTITTTIVHETVSATATSTALVSEEAVVPPTPGPQVTINAVEGQAFTTTVATFTDGSEPASDFTATISWGDGTTSQGTVSGPDSKGVFSIIGTHTYAEESNSVHGGNPFTITVNIHNQINVSVTAQAFVAEAPITATGGYTINAVAGQPFTAAVATFVDTGGPETTPSISANYSATINWGDNTSSAGTITLSGNVFTVSGSHTYSGSGTFTITVTIVHETVSATATSTASVPAVLVPEGGLVINAVEGQSFTATVATFTGSASKAVINWGDGTTSLGTISGPNGNGLFTVTGTHTYSEESKEVHGGNPFIITVTLYNSTSLSVTDSAIVAEAPITASGGFTLNTVEGQSITGTVATFIDTGGPETTPTIADNYTATIDWGDNTTSTGTITYSNGVFTVTGNHAYTEETNAIHGGPFAVTVTIVHETVSATATSTVNVAEAPLSATGGLTINGVEGQSFTATVATFTDTGGPENASLDYTASIDWGDGTTSAGTISGPDQNGVFTVTGSHAYAEETNQFHGTPTITVTITHETVSAVVTDTPSIADAPLSATAGSAVNAVAGQDVTAVVATFTDTGGPENARLDYTASIDWGDGTTSTGTISGPDQNGVFTVTGDHTYAAGSFAINVTITHESGGGSVTVSTSASVAGGDMALAATGMNFTAVPFQGQDQMVAFFTDADANAQAANFVATIDWGDGTQVDTGAVTQPGGPGTPFFVDFMHAYNNVGTFAVHVHIIDMGGVSDSGGAFADAVGTATVLGGGAASLLGQAPTGMNGLQILQASPVQQATPVPVMMAHEPASSGTADNDLYWGLYASQGDRLPSLSAAAANDLALAWQGLSR